MPETVANQIAAAMAILTRIEQRAEEDRRALLDDRAKSEMARSAVSAELTDIRHKQDNMTRRLDKVEPVTDMVTSVRSRVTGGLMLLGVIGGVAWAGVVFFKDVIMGWFQ